LNCCGTYEDPSDNRPPGRLKMALAQLFWRSF
jgi:hypothetical protein